MEFGSPSSDILIVTWPLPFLFLVAPVSRIGAKAGGKRRKLTHFGWVVFWLAFGTLSCLGFCSLYNIAVQTLTLEEVQNSAKMVSSATAGVIP